jgi:hypothetical protein
MFAELEKVMGYSIDDDNFIESLGQNVIGKKSNSGVSKTSNYLKSLYGFDSKDPAFSAFKYFWKIAENKDKPLLAFIYAINHDNLLAESIQVVSNTQIGEKASIESFEQNIERYHPSQYSENTRKSLAQNIASSWKQAGFIEGKVKNIRKQIEISYNIACFAFLLAYLQGDKGDFIWHSKGVEALCLYESKLRELVVGCARRDLIQYQYAGNVTVISFDNLLNKIGIDAI